MEKTILILNIANGAAALLAGAGALFARKGGRFHKQAGQVFFWAMLVVLVTAVLLAIYKVNLFLLCVAVFSFYLAYTGYRAIHYSRQKNLAPTLADKLVLWLSGAVALAMLWAAILPLLQGKTGINLVLMVFGGFLLSFCLADLRVQYRKIILPPRAFLLSHISRMCGAFIATVTAALVTNVQL
ncbi:MAG: hypothetical protein EOP51_24700, partial [Sphingobacteriales bacterium]